MQHEPTGIRVILMAPDKKVDEAQNELSRLFRQLLLELGIGPRMFERLMKRYLHDPNSGIEQTQAARNNNRGNLMKEFSSPSMTWNVFQKGLRFLAVEEYELVLNLKRKPGISKHVMRLRNNIAYLNEPSEDVSRTNFINQFESDANPNIVFDECTVADELPEGVSTAVARKVG